MSVFSSSDDRIVIEEIVEATTEDQVELCSTIETIDESSVATSVAVTEIAEAEDQQLQQQQQHTHSHHHTSTKNGGGNGHLSRQSLAVNHGSGNNNNNNNNNSSSTNNNNNNNNNNNSNSNVGRVTPRSHMEQEKRMRREIANSNERRRMQSINAGFQSLRTLLPHHEGEKLSKAAILQQTAEYIYQLEQEKTHLLSQNSQLKRLVNQHEGGEVPIKKRKAETQGVVVSLPMHVNESGDEGLGSMSPEPLSVITVTTEAPPSSASSHSVVNSEVIVELRRQLERERHARLLLEKQMRAYQSQLYPERFRDNQLMTYQPHEVIEHTDNVMAQETEEAVAALQVVSVVSLPPVGSTQTVETSSPDPSSPPLSPEVCDVVPEDVKDEESRPESPKILAFATNATFAAIDEQSNTDSFTQSVTYVTTEFKASPQFITASPPRPFSPETEPQRLPSVLEAAMKAEPKVEVERLPSPSNTLDDGTPQARLYLANTSRQNLETIVEAIRHLEGDHLFSDEPAQDVPLALTNKPTTTATIIPSIAAVAAAAAASATTATTTTTTTTAVVVPTSNAAKQQQRQLLHAEVNNFLQFHSQQQQQQQQQQTQQRPGVIVVKHS